MTVYPQLGGKVASIWDKQEGRELLFDNPWLQPAALGRADAFTSGGVHFLPHLSIFHTLYTVTSRPRPVGIEWNWPRLGHTVFHMHALYAGAVLQTMFGIKGGRFDSMPTFSSMYNEQWTRPLPSERPSASAMRKMEHSAYWRKR